METLAPSVLQIRNSFLEQFQNEQLDAISKKLDQLFDVETDPVKRIILLASRVDTIRKRIELIYQDDNKIKKITEIPEDKKEEITKNDTETNETVFVTKDTPIPATSSLELLAGNKVVLQATDVLKIDSDVAGKIDATLSIMEIT